MQKIHGQTQTGEDAITSSETDCNSDFNSPETVSSACERRHVKNPPQRPTVDCVPNSAGCQYTDPTTS